MYQRIKKAILIFLAGVLFVLPAVPAFSLNIGYYDTSREVWGFDGNSYMTDAKQWLLDEGHTLINTAYADSTFLGGVDAFFTALIDTVDTTEISAMQEFVDVQGGFLFLQTDHSEGTWFAPNNLILANWGISIEGHYTNDTNNTTVGNSDWVTDPNVVTSFIGKIHSIVTNTPTGFEVLGMDDSNRTILGVFDAGAGRSSDVLVSTDIDFFSDSYGWLDENNRKLWENIWTSAAEQIDPVPEPGTFILLGVGLAGLAYTRKKKQRK